MIRLLKTWQPTALKITFALIVLAIGAVVVYGFAAQSQRITSWEARYDSLFQSYQELDADCAIAADCQTDAPSPSEVAQAPLPGAQGAQGEPGVDGRDGRTPTASEVLEAIRAYCSVNNGCAGPQGSSGSNGADGATGAPGTPGTNGIDGVNGADGRGIASVTCVQADLTTAFRFTYTDGTSTDVPGSCIPTE